MFVWIYKKHQWENFLICLFGYIKTAISLFDCIKSHQWENSIDGLKIKLICCLDKNIVGVAPLC